MNRKKSGWLTVAFLFGLITTSMGQNQAVTYPAPEGVEMMYTSRTTCPENPLGARRPTWSASS